ncbi:MAG: HAD-IA family hydrolase, partial [Elusimicrobiaceae bacterium]|nr:HAD-IA family hydrolase [Elusimicrobiaceae bacterium]
REDANQFMRQPFGNKIYPDQLNKRAFLLVEEYLMSGQDIPMKPGAKEAVEMFYRRNLKLGLASSNMRRWIDFYLKKTGLGFYFNTVTSCEEVSKLKPDPEVYLKTAAKLQSDVTNCLVFEDSVPGVTAGICAGMRTCMVPDLKQPNTFVRENAFKIYNSLLEVRQDCAELLS